jgi:hypothetical protein
MMKRALTRKPKAGDGMEKNGQNPKTFLPRRAKHHGKEEK